MIKITVKCYVPEFRMKELLDMASRSHLIADADVALSYEAMGIGCDTEPEMVALLKHFLSAERKPTSGDLEYASWKA